MEENKELEKPHKRRVRYKGTHPRKFEEKYKELQRDQSAVSENEDTQSEGDYNKTQSDTDWLLPLLWNH